VLVNDEEHLREALVSLGRSRDEQEARRVQAERMTDALMTLTEWGTLEQTFATILQAFCGLLEVSDGLLIIFDKGGLGATAAATSPRLASTSWRLGPTFKRALERGRPIAGFDAAAMPEWREQPRDVLEGARSALLVPLTSGELSAILAVVHASQAFFDAGHKSSASRLIPAASKALSHAQAEEAEHRLLAAIEQANEQLKSEISDRARLEEELQAAREAAFRREIQEKAEIIEHQRAAIRALSTPIVEVWPEILCLPVVGFLDEGRSAQVAARVLEAVNATRARAVIIDVTALDRVDADIIVHLVRIAGAVRLLGASCVFTGVRPEVARTIIEMNIDASGLVTFQRVRDALARLLQREEAPPAGPG
jgi:anti-anti-sigma regulatory factor